METTMPNPNQTTKNQRKAKTYTRLGDPILLCETDHLSCLFSLQIMHIYSLVIAYILYTHGTYVANKLQVV